MQARLTDVLGLHRTNSTVSVDSISSFAGSINTKKAFRKFCKDLFEIGVTKEMISQKEGEIRNIFQPQNPATSSQVDDDSSILGQSQLPVVSDFSSIFDRNILTKNRTCLGLAFLNHQ